MDLVCQLNGFGLLGICLFMVVYLPSLPRYLSLGRRQSIMLAYHLCESSSITTIIIAIV